MSYYQCTDRIIMVKINSYPNNYNEYSSTYLYATTTHNGDEIEEVFDKIHEVLKMTKARENCIILGDWNASVGE